MQLCPLVQNTYKTLDVNAFLMPFGLSVEQIRKIVPEIRSKIVRS